VTYAFAAVLGLLVGVVTERAVGPPAPRTVEAPAGAPGARPPRRRRSRGRIVAWSALAVFGLLLVATIGGYLWASSVFNRIEKVDVSAQLRGGSGTNYLLVGADNSRDADTQRPGVQGVRSDTIMVLRVEGGHAKMLSLNRDLWIDNPATGTKGRLNATYNQGPANLVQAVTQAFGIPIERYIEIDFVSFAGLVDAFGGIDVEFAHPAFDLASGLDVKQAGVVHLDGAQALAYVRSRHYTEVVDGRNVPEGGLPDVNRTGRQQVFLRQIMAKAGNRRNPFTLMSAASRMAKGLRIDDDMTLLQAARFAWDMGRLNPERVVLPVVPRTTGGGAAVLDLGPGADAVLAQFR
jgi:LCP family protein required for cell wall assembly